MSIVRIEHDKTKPFVVLNKQALQDPLLSWASKGLWAFLLTLPDNWQISVAHLATIFKGEKKGNGRDAIRDMLLELKTRGYVIATPIKDKGKFGGLDYVVYESRQNITTSESVKPKLKKIVPKTVYPGPVYPAPDKPTQTINNDNKNESIEYDNNVKDHRSLDSDHSIVLFDENTYMLPNGERLSLRMRQSIAKYTPEQRVRLQGNVAYFEKMVKKSNVAPNKQEAYLQNCINNNYADKMTNAMQNEIYIKFIKEEHKLRKLEILKTVVRFKRSEGESYESISLSLPPISFANALDQYIQKNKGK